MQDTVIIMLSIHYMGIRCHYIILCICCIETTVYCGSAWWLVTYAAYRHMHTCMHIHIQTHTYALTNTHRYIHTYTQTVPYSGIGHASWMMVWASVVPAKPQPPKWDIISLAFTSLAICQVPIITTEWTGAMWKNFLARGNNNGTCWALNLGPLDY